MRMDNVTVKNIKFCKYLNISTLIYPYGGNKVKKLKFRVHCTSCKCCKYNCTANVHNLISHKCVNKYKNETISVVFQHLK